MEPTVPDRTLTDVWGLEHGDEKVRIKHYGPAHTGGDVVIYFEKANVAHMGDLMFNRCTRHRPRERRFDCELDQGPEYGRR